MVRFTLIGAFASALLVPVVFLRVTCRRVLDESSLTHPPFRSSQHDGEY